MLPLITYRHYIGLDRGSICATPGFRSYLRGDDLELDGAKLLFLGGRAAAEKDAAGAGGI